MPMSIGIAISLVTIGAVGVLLARLVKVTTRLQTSVRITDLRAFARELDQRVVEYLRANYSGDPAQLEGALRGLLPITRDLARQHAQELDDSVIRTLLVAVVSARRFASRKQVEAAFDAAVGGERIAA